MIGRNNCLSSDTPAGAQLDSIVETVKANGLEPYAYLSLIFEKLPLATTPTGVKALLPWNVQPAQLKPTQCRRWPLLYSSG